MKMNGPVDFLLDFKLVLLTCICPLIFISPAHGAQHINLASGTLDVGASLRFRYEYLDQYNIKKYSTEKSDTALLSRLRLELRYRLPNGLGFFIQGQDARFWFSEDIHKSDFIQSCPYYNSLDLRKAYVEWHSIGQSPLGFKLGRQAIFYGDKRIFGPGEWGNVVRYAWDAAKLMWRTPYLDLDLVYGRRVLYLWDEFDDAHYDYDLYSLYGQIKCIRNHQADIFIIIKSDDDNLTKGESVTGDILVRTIGFYGKGKLKQADYSMVIAFQSGNYGKDDIRALGFSAETGYTLAHRFKPRFSVLLTYGSGDDDPNDGVYETFDGVFGAVDAYFGRMNLFSWMNIMDFQAGFEFQPMNGLKIRSDYHHFWLNEKEDAWYFSNGKKMRLDADGSSGSDLGREVDLICKYRVNDHIEMMIGCGVFLPAEFIEKTGTHKDAKWVFTQMILSL